MTTSPNAPRPCEICGGPAPLTQDDSSHDDCGVATTSTPWTEGEARIVASVPKSANFEFGWNGFEFFTLTSTNEMVAVAR